MSNGEKRDKAVDKVKEIPVVKKINDTYNELPDAKKEKIKKASKALKTIAIGGTAVVSGKAAMLLSSVSSTVSLQKEKRENRKLISTINELKEQNASLEKHNNQKKEVIGQLLSSEIDQNSTSRPQLARSKSTSSLKTEKSTKTKIKRSNSFS